MASGPEKVVLSTDLPGAISRRQGKVRDIYEYEDGLLLIATDRVSAFDVVMPTGIPDKGRVLTQVSSFWFDKTKHIVPNHLISTDVADFPEAVQPYSDMLEGRSMWCKKAEVVPVECVVRGYLAGSAWKAYSRGETYCGYDLPDGLKEADRLTPPLFTPSTKAEDGHDVPITREQCVELCCDRHAMAMESLSIELYRYGWEHATTRGLILADTKFEFGLIDDELVLIDEMLTPDSSRYWAASEWHPGHTPEGFDKQYLRDWLETLDWDKTPPGPELPGHVVARTRELYLELMRRITGETL
ncbi:MAG: phosphoribosylaminoimidazolesuccinocarboxamide synthase [candidate division WS1 bacterium]|jgi:phosphoribosylaminoimidazole-succinocarboxamide synthase|nr:phosphoribosylaminoimidazolesuccinocarboxamide synthase [candidate division WS1 bacterium]